MNTQHRHSMRSRDISWPLKSLQTAKPSTGPTLVLAAILLSFCSLALPLRAQWVAYNDQNRGANTAPFVSTYSLTKSGTTIVPAGGPLTNFATGLTITNAIGVVGVSISATGSVDSIAISTISPTNYSPAGQIFNGKIDWNNSSIQFGNLTAWATSSVTIVFTNLTPGRQYKFRATGGRGLNYSNRWTLATLAGASNATHAHLLATNSPGIVTNGWSPYGDTLDPRFQALWNSGINICGDVIGWDNIVPMNNSFSVVSSNWTLAVPSPISGTNSASVFAFAAFSLEEVFQPIAIVSQPQDTVACPGATVSFSVGVTGDQPAYQWRSVNGGMTNLIDGATNATLFVSNIVGSTAYFVVVSNSLGAVTSTLAHVSIGSGGIEILAQPQNQTNVAGTTASFVVILSTNTSRPITLRWYYSPVADHPSLASPIAGAADLTLALSSVSTNDVGFYFAVLTNCAGVATSQLASLSVYYVPAQITANPGDITTMQNSPATLSAQASGTPPISYQWYKEGTAIPNATNSSLILPSLLYNDSGHYYVVAANPAPSAATSGVAMVIVNLPAYNIMPITNYVWKFNQNPSGLDTVNWTAPSYDDSAWPSGMALLGHCTSNYSGFVNNPRLFTNTDLKLNNGDGTTNITYYFRTKFVATNHPSIVQLTASNFYAHGIVVYLNGTEAYRMNMPSGKITCKTFASSAYIPTNNPLVGVMWPTNIPMALSSSLLVQGTNTLAVECHKYGYGAPDIYMGVSLSASFPSATVLQITNDPVSVTIPETQPAAFSVGYMGAPAFCQWYFQHDANSPIITLPGATKCLYSPTNTVAGVNDGYYWVTLSNLLSYVTSAKARLTIIPDTNAPMIMDADGTHDPNTITLSFSRELLLYDASRPVASPTNLLNFSVTNTFGTEVLTIAGGLFQNGTNVILTTAQPRQPNVNYIVTVGADGVEDMSLRHNLAVNIAAPVSSLVTVLSFDNAYDEWYQFTGLLGFGLEENVVPDINSRAWLQPGYLANEDYGWSPGNSPFWYYSWSQYPLSVTPGTELFQGGTTNASYFLKDLLFSGGSAHRKVWLRYIVDGGFVLYLNGAEFWRTNLPAGPPTINSLAVNSMTTAVMTDYIPLDPSLLRIGSNRFAVEYHPDSLQTLHMAYAAEITAQVDSLVLGQVVITTQPADLAVSEGDSATFSVREAGGQYFQWMSNHVVISGATNDTYRITNVTKSMEGKQYGVLITGLTNSLLSSSATLHVISDTDPPVLLSAYLTDTNVITITFNKPVDAGSASNLLNYAVTNAVGPNPSIKSITMGANGTSVQVTLNPFVPGQFTVVVTHLRDASLSQNWIASNSRVTVGLLNYPLLSIDTNSLWKFNEANNDLGGTGWNTRTYDDTSSEWAWGGSLFDGKTGTMRSNIAGYAVATHLNITTNSATIPTFYFRKWLSLPVFGSNATMTITHMIDDSAAFYMNGKLFYAFNLNTPTVFGFSALSTIDTATPQGPFNVQATNMVVGTNLLAVDLHQIASGSSDATFGAMLTLNLPSVVLQPGGETTVPPLFITRQDSNQVRLWWTDSGPFTLQSADLLSSGVLSWTPVANQANPFLTPATNAAQFYRLRPGQ